MTKEEYAKRLEVDGYDTPEKLWGLILGSEWHCDDDSLFPRRVDDNRALLKAAIERLIALEVK